MPDNIYDIGHTTRFSKTNQPANSVKGRKPSRLKKYLKENNLGQKDMRLIAGALLTKSKDDLKKIIENPRTPILVLGAAAAILKDIVKGRTDTVQWLIDRAFGKSVEYIDLNAKLKRAELTDEERQERIKELLEKRDDK